jgi:hypothetical protein
VRTCSLPRTLYCIGAHKDYASVAPLFCALTGLLIYDTAKHMAQQTRSGRLDPPVLFPLDEAPNVVPPAHVRSTAAWVSHSSSVSSHASNWTTYGTRRAARSSGATARSRWCSQR